MVSIKSFLTTSVAVLISFATVEAAVAPAYPQPGAVETIGQAFDIKWTFDGKNASTTYKIDFMTGSNSNQTFLANVATKVKADALSYSFIPPSVTPTSAIYFFMFTGSDGSYSWTTRFGLIQPGGSLTPEPESTQPNGDAIPWGVGQLGTATVEETVEPSSVEPSSVEPSHVESKESASQAIAVAAASVQEISGAVVLKPILTLVSLGAAAYLI